MARSMPHFVCANVVRGRTEVWNAIGRLFFRQRTSRHATGRRAVDGELLLPSAGQHPGGGVLHRVSGDVLRYGPIALCRACAIRRRHSFAAEAALPSAG